MSDEQQWTGKVEQWGIFELSLEGPEDANPFLDVRLSARFRHGNRVVEPDGFYDGGGTYRVRFMPDTLGAWSFETRSNRDELDGITEEFVCTEPSPDNHGPVRVHDKHHFSYADGTPHVPVGTTCYVWTHQGDELEEETLNTLRHAPFNKLRMCVFPKHYAYNENEPPAYPFERAEGKGWDFERFDPGFFRRLEGRVGDLMELGTEADVILFHPYDRWGFATMPAEVDDRYLRYIVARLGAYRNVWWSMANEYDLMREKSTADWDRIFRVVQESDPYQHLRSVHNWHEFYDHGKPWVTHQSIQHSDLGKTDEWRELYRKPVMVDECCYEGNIAQHWGNISAREMVHRFWEGTVRGGYVGHGETYTHPEDVLWWSKGGVLHGQSPERIAFLRKVLDRSPVESLDPLAPQPRRPRSVTRAVARRTITTSSTSGVTSPQRSRLRYRRGVGIEARSWTRGGWRLRRYERLWKASARSSFPAGRTSPCRSADSRRTAATPKVAWMSPRGTLHRGAEALPGPAPPRSSL